MQEDIDADFRQCVSVKTFRQNMFFRSWLLTFAAEGDDPLLCCLWQMVLPLKVHLLCFLELQKMLKYF